MLSEASVASGSALARAIWNGGANLGSPEMAEVTWGGLHREGDVIAPAKLCDASHSTAVIPTPSHNLNSCLQCTLLVPNYTSCSKATISIGSMKRLMVDQLAMQRPTRGGSQSGSGLTLSNSAGMENDRVR